MRYSLGTNLADFGFAFLEKIHHPIFLIHRLGRVTQINEAGRKLLRIAHINREEVENFARALLRQQTAPTRCDRYRRLRLRGSSCQMIVRKLEDSDYLLVEVQRIRV